jgi:hypothetical protein
MVYLHVPLVQTFLTLPHDYLLQYAMPWRWCIFWAGIFLFVFSVVSVGVYIENEKLQKEAEIAL